MRSYLKILLFLLISQISNAGDITLTGRLLTPTDGLSSYNVQSLVTDKYGFIWAGTQDGLNFFDGTSFKIFNKSSAEPLAGNDVNTVLYDSANNLVWVAFSYGGISAVDARTHKVSYTLNPTKTPQLFKDPHLKRILLTKKGELLIISEKRCELYNFISGSHTAIFKPGDIPQNNYSITTGCEDNLFYYLFINTVGIACIYKKSGVIEKIIPVSDSTGEPVMFGSTITVYKSGFFFATKKNIQTLNYKQECSLLLVANNTIINFNCDQAQNIWVSTGAELIKYNYPSYRSNQPVHFSYSNTPFREQFHLCILFDNTNNVFIGTSEGLLAATNSLPIFAKFTNDQRNGKEITHLYDILPVNRHVYINDLTGLKSVNTMSREINYIDTSGFPYYIMQLKNGDIIFNNEDGFAALLEGKLNKLSLFKKYPELFSIKHRLISCHLQLSDSIIILGGEDAKGIAIWNINKHSIKEVSPDIKMGWKDAIVNQLFKKDDYTFLICQDKCIAQYDIRNNLVKSYTVIVEPIQDTARLYFDILREKDNYWIAAYGYGVIITDTFFRCKKIINSFSGLSNNGVYRLLKDEFKFIWVSTNYGLNRIQSQTFTTKQYFETDGLNTNSFEEMSAALQDTLLFFGGINGFTIINPRHILENTKKPEIYFSRFIFTKKNNTISESDLEAEKIIVTNSTLQTIIHFLTINYSAPQAIKYKYRIKEVHNDWISLNNQNFITLIGLSPGTYHLQVQAFNEDGIGSEIKELTLVFLPKWYQTWWFKSLIALAIIGIGYATYRLRIHQLKKEEKIRNQLASDLHDDLGSTLNSVKVYSNLAMMEKENPQHLLRVKESTQEAIAGVRDLIWVLDDKKDTVQDLLSRINQFAAPLCEANHISYAQHIDDNLYHYKLGKEEKRNLYMIIKESVNNSIKYAGCQTIELKVAGEGKKVQFTIRDDGKGFDMGKIKPGNGLKNIAARAKEIGYASSITAKEGNGTIIELKKA